MEPASVRGHVPTVRLPPLRTFSLKSLRPAADTARKPMSSTSATGTSSLAISGLASGFDWQSLVSQLVEVERAPETRLQNQQTTLQQQNNALTSIKTELSVLQNAVTVL